MFGASRQGQGMRWLQLLSLTSALGLLGIDYGSDFVKSSLVCPGTPFEIVLTPDSQRKDASGLVITPTDFERLYGSRGLPLQSKYPQSSLYSIKQLLGVPFNDIRMGLFEEIHPGLTFVNTSRNSIAIEIANETFTVEEIVAMQLRDIAARSTDLLRDKMKSKREKLTGLTISVPGHFGSLQRQALIDSAALADVELAGLVSDHVAVALNYANSPSAKLNQNLVVFDMGASATSATLLRIDDSNGDVDVTVLGYGSDVLNSGESLTLLLRETLLQKFATKLKAPLKRTPRMLNRLWREAERAKQVLSANNEVHVHVENLYDDEDLSAKITRSEFEEAAEFQRNRVVDPVLQAIQSLPNGVDDVDLVVIVGGATRTPFVREELSNLLGDKVKYSLNADEANVQGTSMRGVTLTRMFRTKKQFLVDDSVTHNYTVEVDFGSRDSESELLQFNLFKVGTSLESTKTIELPVDVKTLYLLEGRKAIATYNLPYASRTVAELKSDYNCTNDPKVDAQFSIDKSGVVKIDKIEVRCKASVTSTILPSYTDVQKTKATTGTESEAEDSEATTTETTGSTTASQSPSVTTGTALKMKRISLKTSWEQAPVGSSERLKSRTKLKSMDTRDGNRNLVSELHHQLETLAYKMRADVENEEFSKMASDLLEFIEDGPSDVDELKTRLSQATDLFKKHVGEPEKDAEAEANEVIQDTITEDNAEPQPEEVNHDEL